jgi:aminoglycoside phosphotransferase (APT) family kinase protein
MAAAIDGYGLRDLRPGFDWLYKHRPASPTDPSILHLDFHPLNLVLDRNRSLVVLDWSEAELGDRHADLGTSLMLMECLPPIKVTRLQRLSILAGRPIFLSRYLRAYRRSLPLDENLLAYYRPWAAFRRLCNYGLWLKDGPEASGTKAYALQCVTAKHRRTLERYFWKWTGVRIRL